MFSIDVSKANWSTFVEGFRLHEGFRLPPIRSCNQQGTIFFQTFGIIMTIGMRAMIERVSVLGANITVSVVLLLGAIGTGTITFKLYKFTYKNKDGLYYEL